MPFLIPAIIAGGAAIASAAIGVTAKAIGDAKARGDESEAMRIRREAAARFGPDIVPKIDKLVAQQYGKSKLEDINEDPALRGNQMAALNRLAEEYKTGGHSAQADEDYMKAYREGASYDAGARGRVQQEMQQRGMAGSGSELLSQLMAGQGGANRVYEGGIQAASANQQRALMAAQAAAQLAGSVRGQDYSIASERAKAQDAIAQWNARNRQDVDQYNNGLQQQQFLNEMAWRKAAADAQNGLAQQYDTQAQKTKDSANQYGSLAAGAVAAAGNAVAGGMYQNNQYNAQQQWAKDNPGANQYNPYLYSKNPYGGYG